MPILEKIATMPGVDVGQVMGSLATGFNMARTLADFKLAEREEKRRSEEHTQAARAAIQKARLQRAEEARASEEFELDKTIKTLQIAYEQGRITDQVHDNMLDQMANMHGLLSSVAGKNPEDITEDDRVRIVADAGRLGIAPQEISGNKSLEDFARDAVDTFNFTDRYIADYTTTKAQVEAKPQKVWDKETEQYVYKTNNEISEDPERFGMTKEQILAMKKAGAARITIGEKAETARQQVIAREKGKVPTPAFKEDIAGYLADKDPLFVTLEVREQEIAMMSEADSRIKRLWPGAKREIKNGKMVWKAADGSLITTWE